MNILCFTGMFFGDKMEKVVTICEIISGISAAIAIIISIIIYRHGLRKERKLDTLKMLSIIRKEYFNTRELDEKNKLKYLNELEYFATGVNEKIYDIQIVKKMCGSRLKRQYNNWAAAFIKKRREKFGNNSAYCEYEKMMEKT